MDCSYWLCCLLEPGLSSHVLLWFKVSRSLCYWDNEKCYHVQGLNYTPACWNFGLTSLDHNPYCVFEVIMLTCEYVMSSLYLSSFWILCDHITINAYGCNYAGNHMNYIPFFFRDLTNNICRYLNERSLGGVLAPELGKLSHLRAL